MLGLCLVAVFALTAAVAVSVAQAEEQPEWGRCVKLAKNKGKYKDANCTELEGKTNGKGVFKAKAKGAYEWYGNADTTCYREPAKKGKYKNSTCTELEGKTNKKGVFKAKATGEYEEVAFGAKFTGESLASSKPTLGTNVRECGSNPKNQDECAEGRATASSTEIECTGESASGEAVGTDEVANVHVVFKGCVLLGALNCQNTATPGEVVVNTLVGKLGYINKANKEVGVDLTPATAHGDFVEFNCGEPAGYLRIVVGEGASSAPESCADYPSCGGDGIISPILPVNKMTHTFTQEYKQERGFVEHTHADGEEAYEFRNVPTSFEGGPPQVLESYNQLVENGETKFDTEWQESSEVLTNVNTVEGEVEIKA